MKKVYSVLGMCLVWGLSLIAMKQDEKSLLIPKISKESIGFSNDPLHNCSPASPRTMAEWMQQYSPRPPGQHSSADSDCQTSMSCFFYYLLCNPLWYSCCRYRTDYHENP